MCNTAHRCCLERRRARRERLGGRTVAGAEAEEILVIACAAAARLMHWWLRVGNGGATGENFPRTVVAVAQDNRAALQFIKRTC
eukprot:SAG11_NODE_8507_length_1008_cov_0.939494_2_plen_84_part_00